MGFILFLALLFIFGVKYTLYAILLGIGFHLLIGIVFYTKDVFKKAN